jgi:hypothetical protein
MHNQTATDEEKLQEEEASQSISSMPKKLKIRRYNVNYTVIGKTLIKFFMLQISIRTHHQQQFDKIGIAASNGTNLESTREETVITNSQNYSPIARRI